MTFMKKWMIGLAMGASVLSSGCKDPNAALPAGTQDPSFYNNPAGALAKRNTADNEFVQALLRYVVDAGLLTDELEDPNTGGSSYVGQNTGTGSLDERILPQFVSEFGGLKGGASYGALQKVRAVTNEAIGALATYDTVDSPSVRGEMYALQGYAEVMLAELFCSGVPLSTYNFQGDFTYKPGSTQQQVYQDAIAKLDTAVALSSDSTRILNLARVGLGRAYLDLGDYVHAAAAVAPVPPDYTYAFDVPWLQGGSNFLNIYATVSDQEGTNGLPFIASGDPRTRDVSTILTIGGFHLYFPKKYAAGLSGTGYSPLTVADGIEAQLIQAEAALNAGTVNWLAILNTLRTDGTFTVTQNGSVVDTLWNAGTGGVSGLAPLADPGATLSDTAATTARVNLVFQERAYWLYVTGHRQGDLRRLVRVYHRDQSTVYPVGAYLAPGQGVYGSDVTAPIPSTETPNPYFHGCLDRNA